MVTNLEAWVHNLSLLAFFFVCVVYTVCSASNMLGFMFSGFGFFFFFFCLGLFLVHVGFFLSFSFFVFLLKFDISPGYLATCKYSLIFLIHETAGLNFSCLKLQTSMKLRIFFLSFFHCSFFWRILCVCVGGVIYIFILFIVRISL